MPKRKRTTVTMGERSGTDGVCIDRNWSELPKDILHLFYKNLPDITDFIRFRAVCKSWRLSAPVNDYPPQLPWLLEHREHPEKHHENAIIRFYCLSSGKVYTVTCPGSRRARLEGPACRYLLASHTKSFQMYLLNPLTNDQIYAPGVNVFGSPDYIGPDPIKGGDIVVVSPPLIEIVVISPPLIENYWVDNIEWSAPHKMMAFWRPDADDWVYVVGVGNSANAFYRGQYFSHDRETEITNVIDVATKKLVYQVAPPEDLNRLLEGCTVMVESGGKILRLFQYYEGEQCHFDIYCLYFGDGKAKPCWVRITDIGDQMLFLQYYRGLSFRASNFARFKGNCIYFLKDERYLCRYDIGHDTTEVLPCPFDKVGSWLVPSLV